MGEFFIGDLVSLKNHPYNIVQNSKIGATALLTPPIMVVTECLISNKYNADAEEKELISTQILCTFFNSKNSSIEKFWFKTDELSKIYKEKKPLNLENESEIDSRSESKDLISMKRDFKNELVVLLTADEELGKKKVSWFKNKEEENYKTEAFLEFLPPVMTVIDVVENLNYLKERRDPKDGSLKKVSCKYLLKCKWYNPIKQTFSEEFIPYKIIQKVSFSNDLLATIKDAIIDKTVFSIISNEKEIKFNNNKLKKIICFKEVIILNHTVKVVYKDIFSNKLSTANLENLNIASLKSNIEELGDKIYPDYTNSGYIKRDKLNWNKNKIYRIKYVDRNGRNTERYITNAELKIFDTEEADKVKFIVANCLLRHGEIRHFKLSNINERLDMKDEFNKLIKR